MLHLCHGYILHQCYCPGELRACTATKDRAISRSCGAMSSAADHDIIPACTTEDSRIRCGAAGFSAGADW